MWNSTKISTKKDLINYISEKSYKKIFVITGQNSFNKSGISKIFYSNFHEKKIKFFFKKSSIPIITELKKIIKSIKIFKPDLIIAAGGGSVIDYAKMGNIIKLGECNRINIIRSRLNFIKRSKLIVIPTTAGSGAEVTSNAVIYINKIKYSVESEKLIQIVFF